MNAESFKISIHPLLKAHGFRKSNATWRRDQGESIAVLNVQKSRWGGGDYYISLGLYFCALGTELSPTVNRCHVQLNVDPDNPATVVDKAIEWFDTRKTLLQAAELAEFDSKKGLVFKEVRRPKDA